MQWQQINGFYYLVRLGSYSKAAEATYRTQSAVTQQIQSLEKTLNCKLGKRQGRGQFVATPEGVELYRFAETMLRKQAEVIEKITAIRDDTEKMLVVAGPADTMNKVVPPYAKKFMAARADVKLRLIESPLDQVVQDVRQQSVDFGLGLMTHIPSDLTQIRWLPLHHYVVARKDHPIWSTRLDLAALASYPLILPPNTEHAQTGTGLTSALSKAGLPYKVVLEATSVDRCIDYAQSGIGIYFALCSDEMLADLSNDMRASSLGHMFRSENIGVFYNGTKTLRPREREFLSVLNVEH